MKPEFDKLKSRDERMVEKAVAVLERTHPEQTADAMGDYISVICILNNVKNKNRVAELQAMLKTLYVRPERALHNNVLIELHDLKEELHEARIKEVVDKQLGDDVAVEKRVKWVASVMVVTSIAGLLLMRGR